MEITDSYHTMNELYEHRHLLFINLALCHKENAFKTRKDDKGEERKARAYLEKLKEKND